MIDIPGVKPKTRLADLTVEQFVELLVQVGPQLRRMPSDEELRRTMTAIREFNADARKSTSDDIYDRIPDLINKLTDSGA